MEFGPAELTLAERKPEIGTGWYRFLFSAADENEDIAFRFLSEFDAILARCTPQSELNLYTSHDYRETLVVEKLQRFYAVCSPDLMTAFGRFAEKYSAAKVTQPSLLSLLLIVGTKRSFPPRLEESLD